MAGNSKNEVNINQEQINFAKWIVSLSIAVISFSLAFLLKNFPNLKFGWIFICGLVLLALSIIFGVCYVYSFLAGYGYNVVYNLYYNKPYEEKPNLLDGKQRKLKEAFEKLKEKYGNLRKRYGFTLTKICYRILFSTFVLGLISLTAFAIINFILQK